MMDTREAIILAGGLGTRLRSVISDLPKPMAPVAGRVFLEIILDHLHQYGVNRVILAVGYQAQKIQDYFGYAYKTIQLEYSVEASPLGTGGAIKQALTLVKSPLVWVINGDTFFDVELPRMELFHYKNSSDLTLALKQLLVPDRYGNVLIDDGGQVVGFEEKSQVQSAGLINGGVYLLKPDSLEAYPSVFSFEKGYLEPLYKTKGVYGYCAPGFFIDIGIPEDYARAQRVFLSPTQTRLG